MSPNPSPTGHNDNRMMHERYNGRPSLATGRTPKMARGAFLLVALAAAMGEFGCAGATFSQGVYSNDFVTYRVGQVGPGWERVQLDDDVLAFHHPKQGTVSITSTCSDYEDVPEEALLNHLLFGMRERNFRSEEMVTVDGRGALHAVIDVQVDGVPVTLEVYLMKKDGCVYDMTLISSREAFDGARDVLTKLIAGFHVIKTNLDG
jgi:hypothetical protein